MKFLICNCCNTIYNKDYLMDKDYLYFCPNINCNGNLLHEIDEYMFPTVHLLHNNGIKTTACCSGHLTEKYNLDIYVMTDKRKLTKQILDKTINFAKSDIVKSNNAHIELFLSNKDDSYHTTQYTINDDTAENIDMSAFEDCYYSIVFRVNHVFIYDKINEVENMHDEILLIALCNHLIYNVVSEYVKLKL